MPLPFFLAFFNQLITTANFFPKGIRMLYKNSIFILCLLSFFTSTPGNAMQKQENDPQRKLAQALHTLKESLATLQGKLKNLSENLGELNTQFLEIRQAPAATIIQQHEGLKDKNEEPKYIIKSSSLIIQKKNYTSVRIGSNIIGFDDDELLDISGEPFKTILIRNCSNLKTIGLV